MQWNRKYPVYHISWKNQLSWRTIRACFLCEYFPTAFSILIPSAEELSNLFTWDVLFCNMSWWCVAFQINWWGSSINVIIGLKWKGRKVVSFAINQNAHLSDSSITQFWREERKEKMKTGRLIQREHMWGNGWKFLT